MWINMQYILLLETSHDFDSNDSIPKIVENAVQLVALFYIELLPFNAATVRIHNDFQN